MNVMQLFLKKYKRKINKVIKGGSILSILFALMISLVIPPFNIHAETITSHVVGTNVWTDRIDYVVVDSSANQFRNYCNVHVEIVFDNDYIGWQNLGLAVYYYSVNFTNNTWTRYNRQVSGNYYINGSSLEIVVPISFDSIAQPYYQAYNGTGQTLPQSDSSINLSFTTQGNVIAFSELQTLTDIYNVLLDIQQNVTDSEALLSYISKIRQLTIPYESYPFVSEFLSRYDPITYRTYYSYQFPLFNIDNTFNISYSGFTSGPRSDYIYKFWINKNIQNVTDLLNYFKIYNPQNNNSDISVTIQSAYMGYINYELWHEITIIVPKPQSGNLYIGIQYINSSSAQIMPIYKGYSNNNRMTTDFALLFGFKNELLENVEKIADGTNQSNQSSSDLNNQTSSFDTTSNSLYNSENAFNTDMNSKLQSIDTSFNPSTSFGSKFLSSANWVKTQFDNLTSTSPFGTVLSFSMLLGLSLLIIGKVFK